MDDAPVELLVFEDTLGFSSSLPPSGHLRLPIGLEAGSPANYGKIRESNICFMCFIIMCKNLIAISNFITIQVRR